MAKIIHCTERHKETSSPVLGRKKHAWDSWEALYASGEMVSCHLWKYPRSAKQIGDRLDLPYLKDVLAAGMNMAEDDDIILWSNDDTIFNRNIATEIRRHLLKYPAASVPRCEFRRTPPPIGADVSCWVKANCDKRHCGRDAFAFTKRWLTKMWSQIPDFILGASEFDVFLTVLIRHYYSIPSPRATLEASIFPADLPRGLVGHITHLAQWSMRNRFSVAPAQKHNQSLYAEAYRSLMNPNKPKNTASANTCVVELGRYGDIINILPICKRIHDVSGAPALAVSCDFADLLDGVSYVVPYVLNFHYSKLLDAVKICRKEFKTVIQTQVWGDGYVCPKLHGSYNLESWAMAGMEDSFYSRDLIPVFDRRNFESEAKLVQSLDLNGPPQKPVVLVGVTSGESSPFSMGRSLLDSIVNRWPNCKVIDLCSIKCRRIYDLLALMERAVVLISSDTVYLHLAAATSLPVVALVNEKPWLGTIPRCNAVATIQYDEVTSRVGTVFDCIAKEVDEFNNTRIKLMGASIGPDQTSNTQGTNA